MPCLHCQDAPVGQGRTLVRVLHSPPLQRTLFQCPECRSFLEQHLGAQTLEPLSAAATTLRYGAFHPQAAPSPQAAPLDLHPDLERILKSESEQGNQVESTSTDWLGASVLLILQQPFHRRYEVGPGIQYQETTEGGTWRAQYHHLPSRQTLVAQQR